MTSDDDGTWRGLIEALLDADMLAWGWRAPSSIGERQLQTVGGSETVRLSIGGLEIPYYNGIILVDFAGRTVTLDAFDQKTPGERLWTLTPDQDWWTRALACRWPG